MSPAVKKSKARKSEKPVPKGKHEVALLHDHISDRVTRIADLILRLGSNRMKANWNIRPTDLRMLDALEMSEPLSIVQIGRLAMIDQAWVSRSLLTLEKDKLVKRKKNPEDSRSSLISLTAKGRRLLDNIRPGAEHSEQLLLDGVNEKSLKKMLDKLESNVNSLFDNDTLNKTVK